MNAPVSRLSDLDREVYGWQLDLPGFGESAQAILRGATAVVSRVGGLGGPLALQLAAAGIGKLVLAHAGNLRPDDFNRQVLMAWEELGNPRTESIRATLQRFNPNIELEVIAENASPDNVDGWVARADIVFGAAPLFEERLALNAACVRHGKLFVDAAMYAWHGQVLPLVPHRTPCLACLYPSVPPLWKRRFPVLGATSALVANMAVLEGIKLLCDLPGAHPGTLLSVDTQEMKVQQVVLARNPNCVICGSSGGLSRDVAGKR